MIVNGRTISLAAVGFRALYKQGFENAAPTYPDWCQVVNSTGDTETYVLVDGLPQMREWVGERHVKNLRAFDYSLRNRNWEMTVSVHRNLFEDDQIGVIKPRFVGMGAAARLHPDKLFADLLSNGFSTGKGYDKVAFFSASHPLDGAVQSNLVSGALASDMLNDGIKLLRQMKNYAGEPIDVFAYGGDLTLMVGPALESTARALVLAEYGDGGKSNMDFNRARLKVNNRITGNAWFLGVAGGPIRPFIHQVRRQPEVIAKDQPSDDCVFTRNEVEYGADGRWEMGYGMYQMVVGSAG